MSVNIENEYGDIDIKNYEDVITSIVQASLEFVGSISLRGERAAHGQ